MQRPGNEERRHEAQCRRRPRRQAEPMRQQINQGADQSDNEANDRKRPGGVGDALGALQMRQREARRESEARLELFGSLFKPRARWCHERSTD